MPPRNDRLSQDRVVDAAAAIVDASGAEALTLSAVAERLGVRTPSLYHHVEGLSGLRRSLRLRGLELLSETMRDATAGRAGRDALVAVGHAYLDFARARPGLYGLTLAATADDEGGPAQRLADQVLATALAVLRGYGIEGDQAVHAARFVRSTLHGFASLEAVEGFALPQDREASIERMLDAMDAGLRTYATERLV